MSRRAIQGASTAVGAILIGLLGSLFSAEIRAATPFYWGPGEIAWIAISFWLGVVGVSSVYVSQQLSRDRERAAAQRQLDKTVADLKDLIRTMPPADFLVVMGATFESALDVYSLAADVPDSGVDDPDILDRAIRIVLGSVATLASRFDNGGSLRYGTNLMLYVRGEDSDPVWTNARRFDEETNPALLRGWLRLNPTLSTTTESMDHSPDPELTELVLAIPKEPRTSLGGPAKQRWKVLPGAPMTAITGDAEYLFDVAKIDEWCEQNGDFTLEQRERMVAYFRDEAPSVQSFVSIPIAYPAGDTERHKGDVLAVLNIHRNQPGMIRGGGTALQHFIPATSPFQMLLARLLMLRQESIPDGGNGVSSMNEERALADPKPSDPLDAAESRQPEG
jgi:hypothetical protein